MVRASFLYIKKNAILIFFVVFVTFLTFLSFLLLRSRTILYYDELFDISPIKALTKGCDNLQEFSGSTILFHCFPFQASNQYQGTVRAFLFYPLVKLNLLNPYSFVAINTILFFSTMLIFYFVIRSISNKKVFAILFTALFVIQPLVWTQFAFDLGPVSTQIFLRTLLLLSVLKDFKNRRICGKYTLLLSGLLIWGKLDGLWFVAGLILGQLVAYGWRIYIRRVDAATIGLLLGFTGAGFYAYIVSQKQNASNIAIDLSDKFLSQIPNDLINGISTLVIPGGTGNSKILSLPLIFVYLVSLVGPFIHSKSKESTTHQFYLFLRIQNIVLIILYVITPRSTAPWHTVSLFPSAIALIATWGIIVFSHDNDKSGSGTYKKLLKNISVPVLIFCILSNGMATYRDYSTIRGGEVNPLFSKELALAFNNIPMKEDKSSMLIFTSWGLYNPVVMDNRFKSPFRFEQTIDGWPWFDGEIDADKISFFKWNLESGPMRRADHFTLVEINPSNLGSNGNLFVYAQDVMKLCEVSQIVLPIGSTETSLKVIKGNRC